MNTSATEVISQTGQHPARFSCIWRLRSDLPFCPTHSHPMVEVVFHEKGSGCTRMEDGRSVNFEPRSVVLYPANLPHDQSMSSSCEDICLHLDGNARSLSELVPDVRYVPPVSPASYVRREFLDLARKGTLSAPSEWDSRVSALLAHLLKLSQPLAQAQDQISAHVYLEQARQYIQENFPRIENVGEIARHIGVSEDYLRHIAARNGGETLGQMVAEARVGRVKELLTLSRLSLKEIAGLCGFGSERYLSTRFRQLTGCTPGTFRRRSLARSGDSDRR